MRGLNTDFFIKQEFNDEFDEIFVQFFQDLKGGKDISKYDVIFQAFKANFWQIEEVKKKYQSEDEEDEEDEYSDGITIKSYDNNFLIEVLKNEHYMSSKTLKEMIDQLEFDPCLGVEENRRNATFLTQVRKVWKMTTIADYKFIIQLLESGDLKNWEARWKIYQKEQKRLEKLEEKQKKEMEKLLISELKEVIENFKGLVNELGITK